MTTFKVGDRVKLISLPEISDPHRFVIGKIYTIYYAGGLGDMVSVAEFPGLLIKPSRFVHIDVKRKPTNGFYKFQNKLKEVNKSA